MSINIYRDNVWSGSGIMDGDAIRDCTAELGDNYDTTEEIYDDIECAIIDGETSIKSHGHTFSWDFVE